MTNDDFLNACANNDVEQIKIGLKDPNVDPAVYENRTIIRAVINRSIDAIQLLMDDGRVDLSARGNTCIKSNMTTIKNNKCKAIHHLIKNDPKVIIQSYEDKDNFHDNISIDIAIKKLLDKKDSNTEASGISPRDEYNNSKLIKLLIEIKDNASDGSPRVDKEHYKGDINV